MQDRRPARTIAVLVLVAAVTAMLLAVLVPAVSAYTDEGDGEQDPTETTTVSEGGVQPAEEVPPPEPEVEDNPWTQRFLAPAVLVLGVLGLVASVVYYGVRVRGRYRVVD